MKTVLEIHIGIRQALQKISSNQKRNFLPEEIDLAFNINQERYVKSKVQRTNQAAGFAPDQKSLDDISELIVSNYRGRVVKQDSKTGYTPLPPNYLYLLEDKSEIITNCHTSFSSNAESVTEHIASVQFPLSGKTSAFYDTLKLTLNSQVIFDNSLFSKTYKSKEERFFIIELMREEINRTSTYKVYWETYKNIYSPLSFIIVSSTSFTGSFVIDSSQTISVTSTPSVVTLVKDVYDLEAPNMLSNNGATFVMQKDPFAKSNLDFVTSYLSGNNLYVVYDSTFIVSNVISNYVRKPRQINLDLNRMCELKEQTHQELVDLTAQYLMLVSENPAYSTKQSDNKINTN